MQTKRAGAAAVGVGVVGAAAAALGKSRGSNLISNSSRTNN